MVGRSGHAALVRGSAPRAKAGTAAKLIKQAYGI
jgi:hypothetical protein